MKKKILCYVIFISLIFSYNSFVFAEDEELEIKSLTENEEVTVEEQLEVEEVVEEVVEEPQAEEIIIKEPQVEEVKEESKAEEPKVEEIQEKVKEVIEIKTQTKSAKSAKAVRTEASAADDTVPVSKVTVNLYARNGSGNYAIAQTWTAVAGGSNTWANADKSAKKYSPITQGDTTYTYTGEWVDDFGNSYTIGERKQGTAFIALFDGQEGPNATLNVYAQYDEWTIPYLTANYIDNIGNAGGGASWKDDGGTGYEHTFKEPVDVPAQYTFLYWKNFDNEDIKNPGETLTIDKGTLTTDTIINYYAVYEYQPSIRLIYHYKDGIKDTGSRLDAIDIYGEEPKDLYWFYEDEELIEEGMVVELPGVEITTDLMNIEEVTEVFAHYFTITWVSENKIIEEDFDVPYGIMPSYDGATPTKEEINKYTYSFSKWTPELIKVTEDATYVAEFTATEKIQPPSEPDPKPTPEPTPEPVKPEPIDPESVDPIEPIEPISVQSRPTKTIYVDNPPAEIVVADTSTTEPAEPTELTIPDTPTPKATPELGSWALINLIATILSCIITVVLIFIKKKDNDDNNDDDDDNRARKMFITKLASLVIGLLSILVFIFTEDIRLPMVMVDRWTLLMIIFTIIEIVNIIIIRNNAKETEEN